jgi:DNA-binding IscR family transcriptional regulator
MQLGADPVSLYDIFMAMDEDISFVSCTHSECSQQTNCGVSNPLRRVQKGLEAFLKVTRI